MLALTVLLAGVVGCGGEDDAVGDTSPSPTPAGSAATSTTEPGTEDTPTTESEDPEEDVLVVEELPAATSSEETPSVSGLASFDRVQAAETQGRTRLAAEQFALEAGLLLYDVRAEPGPAEIADALAARSMREDLRRYLIEDREQLIQAERQRRRRTDVEAWIRSAVDGPDEAPDKVDVELASVTTLAEGLSYWDTRRYVVVWEDEGWRLQDTILSNTGPGGDQPLTSQQRRDYLTGTGWRRIPPA